MPIPRVILRVDSRRFPREEVNNNEQVLIPRVIPRVDSRTFPHEEVEQQQQQTPSQITSQH